MRTRRLGIFLGIFVVAAMLGLPLGQAWAGQNNQGQNNNDQGNNKRVPEFSPAAMPAAAAILVGASLVLSHRRKTSRQA